MLGTDEELPAPWVATGPLELLALAPTDALGAVVAELAGSCGMELAAGGVVADGRLLRAPLLAETGVLAEMGVLEGGALAAPELVGASSGVPSFLVSAEQPASTSTATSELLAATTAAM